MAGGGGGSIQRPIYDNDNGFDCESITFTTNLSSPDPVVLKKILTGDVLDLSVDSNSQAIIAKHNGEVAGSISHYRYSDLINCITDGHIYVAKVQRVIKGLCEVTIFHS